MMTPVAIPILFNEASGELTHEIEVGRYSNGSIWLPVGFQTGNLTFELAPNPGGTFYPLSTVSVSSAAASNCYSLAAVIPLATVMKIRCTAAQDPTLTCYLILKG